MKKLLRLLFGLSPSVLLKKLPAAPGQVVFTREFYSNDWREQPNDHCFWDTLFGGWLENDEHFRNRIKRGLENKAGDV